MAGTARGVINQWLSTGTNMEKIINAYKNVYDRWAAHPGVTLIADGWGGGGQDYHDGASPYGDDSFSVWRFDTNVNRSHPFYVLMCAADSGSSSGLLEGGSNPNTPTLLCSVALGIGGDGNPCQQRRRSERRAEAVRQPIAHQQQEQPGHEGGLSRVDLRLHEEM
mgnify:CR=1 FL=1